MKRLRHTGQGTLIEDANGEYCKFADVPKLDKPAALMALIAYRDSYNVNEDTHVAIHKLAAAIIAEVEAGE